MNRPSLPRYTVAQLVATADRFLRQYHPSGAIPLPIEEIAELTLGLHVLPVAGLRDTLGVDAFTTSDLRWVSVDEWQFLKVPVRHRFTMAHEIGHIVLHGSYYRTINVRTVADAKAFLSSISEDENRWLEWHANAFAGRVLVPRAQLVQEMTACRERIRSLSTISTAQELLEEALVDCLAQAFAVSTEVIRRRLSDEKLRPRTTFHRRPRS